MQDSRTSMRFGGRIQMNEYQQRGVYNHAPGAVRRREGLYVMPPHGGTGEQCLCRCLCYYSCSHHSHVHLREIILNSVCAGWRFAAVSFGSCRTPSWPLLRKTHRMKITTKSTDSGSICCPLLLTVHIKDWLVATWWLLTALILVCLQLILTVYVLY